MDKNVILAVVVLSLILWIGLLVISGGQPDPDVTLGVVALSLVIVMGFRWMRNLFKKGAPNEAKK